MKLKTPGELAKGMNLGEPQVATLAVLLDRKQIVSWIAEQIRAAKEDPHCEDCHQGEGLGLHHFREHAPPQCPKGKGPVDILRELVEELGR